MLTIKKTTKQVKINDNKGNELIYTTPIPRVAVVESFHKVKDFKDFYEEVLENLKKENVMRCEYYSNLRTDDLSKWMSLKGQKMKLKEEKNIRKPSSKASVIIKKARVSDIPNIHILNKELIQELKLCMMPDSEAHIKRYLKQYYIALVKSRVVGFLRFIEEKDYTEINSIIVSREFRRMSIAKALLYAVLNSLKRNDSNVFLTTKNPEMIVPLAELYGFRFHKHYFQTCLKERNPF